MHFLLNKWINQKKSELLSSGAIWVLWGPQKQRFRCRRLKHGASDCTWSKMKSHIYIGIAVNLTEFYLVLCNWLLVLGGKSLRIRGRTGFLVPTLCFHQFFLLLTDPPASLLCCGPRYWPLNTGSETSICQALFWDSCPLLACRHWWASSSRPASFYVHSPMMFSLDDAPWDLSSSHSDRSGWLCPHAYIRLPQFRLDGIGCVLRSRFSFWVFASVPPQIQF